MIRARYLHTNFSGLLITQTIFVLLLLTGTIAKAQDPSDIKIQLKWQHQFQFAGYYAAQVKGYFEQEGLDVQLLEGSANTPPVPSVLNGQAHFGVTGSDILNYHIEKKPVVAISAIFQHSPYVFITLADKGIHTPTDLAGRSLMASKDQGWLLLRAVFLKEGIDINQIKITENSWNSQDLIDGKVDAMSAYITVEPQQIRKKGFSINLIKPNDYGIDFYGDLLFTTRTMAENHPETVERLNHAVVRGWEYAMNNPEEIADYIINLPGVKARGISRDDLIKEASEMQKLILPDLVEIGHMNPGRWQNMLDIYKQLGIAGKEDTLDGLLFKPSITRKALNFDILLYSMAVGGSLFVLALIWNWQLRKTVQKKTADLQREINVRKTAEQRLELAIEAAGLGIWEWNLVTGDRSYDKTWVKSLGYDPETFSQDASTWMDMVHPEDHENVQEIMTALIKGVAPSRSLAYRLKTGEGNWKWILSFSKIQEFQEDGKAHSIIGTHLDIDFIKGKESELHDITTELRKTNAELEKFAYITSHNLRAPVVNLVSLAEMQSDDSISPELNSEITAKIHYCVKQLDTTLNDLIEVVASKSKDVQKENLNIQDELTAVIRSIEKQVNESGAQIDTNFTEVKEIYFPKRFLQSILLNLLTNAIKYRSDKRRLNISLKTRSKKDHVILYFSDNGSGMDMEKFGKKIFGLYQRFHGKIDGKGLGLYIIKSQIESLDGKIEVDSMPDVGTTFKISFRNTALL